MQYFVAQKEEKERKPKHRIYMYFPYVILINLIENNLKANWLFLLILAIRNWRPCFCKYQLLKYLVISPLSNDSLATKQLRNAIFDNEIVLSCRSIKYWQKIDKRSFSHPTIVIWAKVHLALLLVKLIHLSVLFIMNNIGK